MVKHLGDRPGMTSVQPEIMLTRNHTEASTLLLNNLDFEYPLYLTFLQAKEHGGYIKKGSKSIEVEMLTHILKEDNKVFVRASALAQKAADFIRNRGEEPVLKTDICCFG